MSVRRRRLSRGSLVALLIALVGAGSSCGRRATTEPRAAGGAHTPFDAMPYAEGRLPDSTRVFLVAGGDDIANFAQEVVTQRQLWRTAGVPADQIACYWAKPTTKAWQTDRDQYRALTTQVEDCRRAEPATLRADLRRIAKTNPKWIYVFVTSHGVPPILQWATGNRSHAYTAEMMHLRAKEADALDQHSIGLQAGPGPRIEDIDRIVASYQHGVALGDLMFSPQTLAETLSEFPRETVKIVVLQACFSGGFIGDKRDGGELSPLTAVDNIVILTATAHDRQSFGCGAGSLSTYYGGAVNKSLARWLRPGLSPGTLPWEKVWEDSAFVVDVMESIDGETPSIPGFYSNVGGASIIR